MATLVGCNQSGSVFHIDSNTGAGSLIGSTGFIATNSLARNGAGTLYSATTTELLTIDPTTGAGALVASLKPVTDVRGLAFSSANVLFAIRDGDSAGATDVPDDLVTIDVATGAVTLVGTTGLKAIQALTFSPGGTLYGWDLRYGLVTIAPTTGAATAVNPGAAGSVVDIQGLACSPNGTLYGASDALYRVDTSTGATTLIGSGGYSDVRGIEFLKTAVVPPRRPGIIRYAWAWMILVGYILITPIGPLCIVCGDPLSGMTIRILGAATIAIGGLALRESLSRR